MVLSFQKHKRDQTYIRVYSNTFLKKILVKKMAIKDKVKRRNSFKEEGSAVENNAISNAELVNKTNETKRDTKNDEKRMKWSSLGYV